MNEKGSISSVSFFMLFFILIGSCKNQDVLDYNIVSKYLKKSIKENNYSLIKVDLMSDKTICSNISGVGSRERLIKIDYHVFSQDEFLLNNYPYKISKIDSILFNEIRLLKSKHQKNVSLYKGNKPYFLICNLVLSEKNKILNHEIQSMNHILNKFNSTIEKLRLEESVVLYNKSYKDLTPIEKQKIDNAYYKRFYVNAEYHRVP